METKQTEVPSLELLEQELKRERYRKGFGRVFFSTLGYLLVVAAITVLTAVLLLPMLQIVGASMADTLNDGEIVVAFHHDIVPGDVIAFYYNNTILIKRVIATEGQWVNIDENGTVYVDGEAQIEPYVTDLALGECDIELPYQVPDAKYFVMGDHRISSIDSRNTAVGCIANDMVVGKIILRVWPLEVFGLIR